MALIDKSPFPFHEPKGLKLQRVLAGIYGTYNSALLFAGGFGVNKIDVPAGLSASLLWGELLERLANLGKVRAAVKATRDTYPDNEHTPFLDTLLVEQSALTIIVDETDPYELLGLFDRVDESDQLAQALMDVEAPPPLNPIVMGILAEVTDEHALFIPRIKSDVLNRVHPNASWSDEYTPWAKTAAVTAEWEIRKIARKKLGADSGKIDDLIEKLGPALAGRNTRFEVRVEDFQLPEVRKKLEEFLLLWGRLGAHAPPPALCIIFVRYRTEDVALAETQSAVHSIFRKAGDQLIAVPPVALSVCDASNFEGWQSLLNGMGKKIDQKAYDALKKAFADGTFRLRDLIDRVRSGQIHL
jgi:hypothetical protein